MDASNKYQVPVVVAAQEAGNNEAHQHQVRGSKKKAPLPTSLLLRALDGLLCCLGVGAGLHPNAASPVPAEAARRNAAPAVDCCLSLHFVRHLEAVL